MDLILTTQQNDRIAATLQKERSRLLNFIKHRVADVNDAEDVLQDVFSQLVEANRLMTPIEQVSGWLYAVARNKITDLFRKKKPESFGKYFADDRKSESGYSIEDLLPSADDGPEAAFARQLVMEELEKALEELPEEQRSVFLRHEVDGESFITMSNVLGVPVNTLISRKHYAVIFLRKRLRALYTEFINE